MIRSGSLAALKQGIRAFAIPAEHLTGGGDVGHCGHNVMDFKRKR